MVRRLIVNADGFGFGAGATQGIIDAVREGGLISSVSVNANFPDFERVGDLVSEFPQLSVGVHLNAMVGRPCLPPSKVRSLVDSDGCFRNFDFLRLLDAGRVSLEELETEFDTQIDRVKSLVGDRLTHLDSQANSHLSYFPFFLRLAKKWGLQRIRSNASLICLESATPRTSRAKAYLRRPHVWLMHCYRRAQMRTAKARGLRMADSLVTVGYAGTGNKSDKNNWVRLLHNLPEGTYEIYCHPGYPDETLRRWSYYHRERQCELEILRSPQLHKLATDMGVELINFHAI